MQSGTLPGFVIQIRQAIATGLFLDGPMYVIQSLSTLSFVGSNTLAQPGEMQLAQPGKTRQRRLGVGRTLL
jgi:hypothetical protein